MENMNDCRQRLKELHRQARAQVDAAKVLQESLAEEADYLQRRDQAQCLDDLRTRVEREIADLRWMESAASASFTEWKLIGGVAKFAAGSLTALLRHTPVHPLAAGAKLTTSELERSAPFGTVVVAIGPSSIPDNVQVIPLSQHARDRRSSEWNIRAAYEAQGYRLVTPDSFFKSLDKVKDNVLKGVSSIRAVKPRLILKPADPTTPPPQKPSPKRGNQG